MGTLQEAYQRREQEKAEAVERDKETRALFQKEKRLTKEHFENLIRPFMDHLRETSLIEDLKFFLDHFREIGFKTRVNAIVRAAMDPKRPDSFYVWEGTGTVSDEGVSINFEEGETYVMINGVRERQESIVGFGVSITWVLSPYKGLFARAPGIDVLSIKDPNSGSLKLRYRRFCTDNDGSHKNVGDPIETTDPDVIRNAMLGVLP